MSSALTRLADEVGVSERTLRRAVGDDVIRARRPSARRLVVSEREAAWIRSHWSLVAALRAALRTEPNVQVAVLFGSVARGENIAEISDVDLLVELRRPAPGAVEALRQRLSGHVAGDLQLVPLGATLDSPRLLAEILRDGRPLVDREDAWRGLRAQARRTQVLADRLADGSRAGARAALDYFQELASTRAQAPVAPDG
jgi:predicted nucleotidyltransferase